MVVVAAAQEVDMEVAPEEDGFKFKVCTYSPSCFKKII